MLKDHVAMDDSTERDMIDSDVCYVVTLDKLLLHASVFPVIKWVVGRTGSTVRCFHDARHVVRLSNCCYRFVSLLLRHHRLTFSEAGGSLLTAGTLPCPLFPHPRAPPLDHVTQSHEPCPGPSVPAQASPCPRAVPPSLTPSVFMSVRASHV